MSHPARGARPLVRFPPQTALCYTGAMLPMTVPPDAERWAPRLARWSQRLRAARLDGLASALLDAAEPLGPLGAHVLWIAQPALGLFVPCDEIGALARVLDQPGGMAWLRDRLVEPDGGMTSHEQH